MRNFADLEGLVSDALRSFGGGGVLNRGCPVFFWGWGKEGGYSGSIPREHHHISAD